jgi:hypothetical protein
MNTIFDALEYIENLAISNYLVGVNEYSELTSFSQNYNSNKTKMYKVRSMPNLFLTVNIYFSYFFSLM